MVIFTQRKKYYFSWVKQFLLLYSEFEVYCTYVNSAVKYAQGGWDCQKEHHIYIG